MQTGNCQSCTCFRPAMDSDQSRALAKGFCSLRGERSVDTYMAACPQFVAMGEEEPFSAAPRHGSGTTPARHGRAQGPQEDLVSELNRKLNKSVPLVRVHLTEERQVLTKEPIDGPEALAEVANRLIGDADREMMLCVHLSIKNHINSVEVIGIGAIDEVIAMPREIFKGAILANAYSVALVHNHPSGDVKPSEDDLKHTKDVTRAGELLGIKLMDSVVINGEGYCSIRQLYPDVFAWANLQQS